MIREFVRESRRVIRTDSIDDFRILSPVRLRLLPGRRYVPSENSRNCININGTSSAEIKAITATSAFTTVPVMISFRRGGILPDANFSLFDFKL